MELTIFQVRIREFQGQNLVDPQTTRQPYQEDAFDRFVERSGQLLDLFHGDRPVWSDTDHRRDFYPLDGILRRHITHQPGFLEDTEKQVRKCRTV